MSLTTPRFLKLPENANLSLRDQICEAVSAAITSESLAFDRPLPSCPSVEGPHFQLKEGFRVATEDRRLLRAARCACLPYQLSGFVAEQFQRGSKMPERSLIRQFLLGL